MADNPVDRRSASILAADVVSYSKMMSEGEAGTLSVVRLLRSRVIEPSISEHKGRLLKTMGNGFLAELPSDMNAVGGAVDHQSASEQSKVEQTQIWTAVLQTGVNLGYINAEDGDILGNGVSLAACLESIAPPGDVAV